MKKDTFRLKYKYYFIKKDMKWGDWVAERDGLVEFRHKDLDELVKIVDNALSSNK